MWCSAMPRPPPCFLAAEVLQPRCVRVLPGGEMGNTCSLHTADGEQSCHSTVNWKHGRECDGEGYRLKGAELALTGFGRFAPDVPCWKPQYVHHVLAEVRAVKSDMRARQLVRKHISDTQAVNEAGVGPVIHSNRKRQACRVVMNMWGCGSDLVNHLEEAEVLPWSRRSSGSRWHLWISISEHAHLQLNRLTLGNRREVLCRQPYLMVTGWTCWEVTLKVGHSTNSSLLL